MKRSVAVLKESGGRNKNITCGRQMTKFLTELRVAENS